MDDLSNQKFTKALKLAIRDAVKDEDVSSDWDETNFIAKQLVDFIGDENTSQNLKFQALTVLMDRLVGKAPQAEKIQIVKEVQVIADFSKVDNEMLAETASELINIYPDGDFEGQG